MKASTVTSFLCSQLLIIPSLAFPTDTSEIASTPLPIRNITWMGPITHTEDADVVIGRFQGKSLDTIVESISDIFHPDWADELVERDAWVKLLDDSEDDDEDDDDSDSDSDDDDDDDDDDSDSDDDFDGLSFVSLNQTANIERYDCDNLPGIDRAKTRAIYRGISYLQGVEGVCEQGPKSCGRITCNQGAAIYWCNNKDVTYARPCKDFAEYAEYVVDKCATRSPGPWSPISRVRGEVFDKVGFSVRVGSPFNWEEC